MPVTSLLVLAVVAVSSSLVRADDNPPASWWGPGQWRRPAIAGLPADESSAVANYTEEYTVYGKKPARPPAAASSNGSAAASDALWADLTVTARTGPPTTGDIAAVDLLVEQGYVPVVTMLRNPDAHGWDFFSITRANGSSADMSEEAVAYAAGFVEGAATYLSAYAYFANTVATYKNIYDVGMGKTASPPDTLMPTSEGVPVNASCLAHFVADHIRFERAHEATSARGSQLRHSVRQLDGLVAGWTRRHNNGGAGYPPSPLEDDRYVLRPVKVAATLDFVSVYLMNYVVEVFDVVAHCAVGGLTGRQGAPTSPTPKPNGHCSALWKLTETDLLASHGTWYLYNSMTRQYKTYNFSKSDTSASLQMSSYPGTISSSDDWYVTGHDMLITETTLNNNNATSLRSLAPDTVSTFQRALVASRLARTPEEWAALFTPENSGTCNNQWMVAQMRWASEDLVAAGGGQALRPGTLWVLEQSPGLVVAEDQTAHLRREGYWASFNSAFYPAIKARLRDTTPDVRGDIFARMQGAVTNVTDTYYLVRYNNFEHDKLATDPACRTPWTPNGTVTTCNISTNQQDAMRAIAARGDLSTTERALYGETDVKVTSAKNVVHARSRVVAQLGPTSVQQPVFVYTDFAVKHPVAAVMGPWVGLPDRFDFAPLVFDSSGALAASLVNGSTHATTGGAHEAGAGPRSALVWAICFVAATALAVVVVGAVSRRRRQRGLLNDVASGGDWHVGAARAPLQESTPLV